MANESTLSTVTEPTSNGQPVGEQLVKQPETETPVQRAVRILSGNIRPEDYLPVSDDIIAFVADGEARGGVTMLPEYRQRMISDLALQAHHAGNIVLSRHTSEGVIVLALGANEIDRILESLPPDKQALTRTEYPAVMIEDYSYLWE
jgi:hypothetical protein